MFENFYLLNNEGMSTMQQYTLMLHKHNKYEFRNGKKLFLCIGINPYR